MDNIVFAICIVNDRKICLDSVASLFRTFFNSLNSLKNGNVLFYSIQRFCSIQFYDTLCWFFLLRFSKACKRMSVYDLVFSLSFSSIFFVLCRFVRVVGAGVPTCMFCITLKAYSKWEPKKKIVNRCLCRCSQKHPNKLRIPCMCCKYFYFNIVQLIFYFLFKSNLNKRFNFIFCCCFGCSLAWMCACRFINVAVRDLSCVCVCLYRAACQTI